MSVRPHVACNANVMVGALLQVGLIVPIAHVVRVFEGVGFKIFWIACLESHSNSAALSIRAVGMWAKA